MTALLIVGCCFTAAGLIGWLLLIVDRHANQTLDTHVDTALAMADARERHPATIAAAAARACPSCRVPVPFGPMTEHVCGGRA